MAANCMIQFQCVQQELQRTDSNIVAADAAGTVGAHFDLCSKWEGLTVYARFQHMAAVYDVALDDGKCAVIPWEVLKETGFYVSLFGTDVNGERLTSARVFVDVAASIGIEGAEPIPPTKTLLDAFVEDAAAARSIAQGVRDDADAGKFVGPAGPAGPAGEGIPDGGTAGQVLRKNAENTTTEWGDANDHKHDASDITSGTLSSAHLPTVPVSKGGTGATSSKGATYNLLSGCKMEELTETTPEGNVRFYMRPYSPESANGGIFAATLGSLLTWLKPKIRAALGFSDDAVLSVAHGGTGAESASDAAANLEVESIGGRTALATNANLNNITAVGCYVCASDATAAGFANCPVQEAFTLTVSNPAGDASSAERAQEVTRKAGGTTYYRTHDGSAWSAWVKRHDNSSPIPASDGGTGETSLQAARSAMGLGDTLGALPVENGGTGATDLMSIAKTLRMWVAGTVSIKSTSLVVSPPAGTALSDWDYVRLTIYNPPYDSSWGSYNVIFFPCKISTLKSKKYWGSFYNSNSNGVGVRTFSVSVSTTAITLPIGSDYAASGREYSAEFRKG